jgi:signal peptidase I
MLPAIWPGDTLVVERISRDQVQVGEIVLVGRDGRLCAHRVVSKAESFGSPQWTTQGDAMPAPDRPVIETELLGRVSHLIRAGHCIAVAAQLSVVAKLMARIVRRCFPAARALVYLHRMVEASEESVLPCQG